MSGSDGETFDECISRLRQQLESAFSPDTAAQGFHGTTPSTGHCAAVAVIVHTLLGGEMISTLVGGHSHWLNRLQAAGKVLDVDLTGDQFGRPALQISEIGQLYPDTRVRRPADLTEETLTRATELAIRAGLKDTARSIAERKFANR